MKRVVAAFLFLTMGCAAPKVGDTGSVIVRPLPRVREPTGPELASYVPVARMNGEHIVIYRVTAEVTKGDWMLVVAQAEVTNDLGYTVGLGRYLKRTLNGAEKYVTRPNMANVTSQMHHESLQMVGYDEVEEDGAATYELVLYAASPYVIAGDYLSVEQNYGSLAVKKTN